MVDAQHRHRGAGIPLRDVAAAQVPPDPECEPAECPETGREYDDDPTVLSPPHLAGPLYACATQVRVTGVWPQAKIEVWVNGVFVADLNSTGREAVIPLPNPLATGDVVQARQVLVPPGSYSSFATVTVLDPQDAFPLGLPTPVIEPLALYECASYVGAIHTVPGAVVTFTQEVPGGGPPVPVAMWEASGPELITSTSVLQAGALIRAQQEICGMVSAVSEPESVLLAPSPLPAPRIVAVRAAAGATSVQWTEAAFGARVSAYVDGIDTGKSWYHTTAFANRSDAVLSMALGPTQQVALTQDFCGVPSPLSTPATVVECDALLPAQMQPPQVGDQQIELDVYIPGAGIRIYADGAPIGRGSGPIVRLTRALAMGETVAVVQDFDGCVSRWAHTLVVGCHGARRVRVLGTTGHYGVGGGDYELPDLINLGPVSSRVRATVRFPTDPVGPSTSVVEYGSARPLVVFMHGNLPNVIPPGATDTDLCVHNSSVPKYEEMGYTRLADHHLGFVSMLEALAREGFIAVSIDAWDINCTPNATYLQEGADLILAHLQYWQSLNDGSAGHDPFGGAFQGRVDLGHIVLAGHSRGAMRLPYVVDTNTNPSLSFATMIMIAPPDVMNPRTAKEIPLLLVRGSRDNEDPSFVYYDAADVPVRSMMYMHGGSHTGYSTMWPVYSEAQSNPVTGPWLHPTSHQIPMLREWARRWARWHLGGHVRDERCLFTGDCALRGFDNASLSPRGVYPSYSESSDFMIDDFENLDETVGLGSVPVDFSGFDEVNERLLYEPAAYPYLYQSTHGVVARSSSLGATMTHKPGARPLGALDASSYDYLSLRVARVYGSMLDLELLVTMDGSPSASGVFSPDVARIPWAPAHSGVGYTALRTLRVPIACIEALNPELDVTQVSTVVVQNSGEGSWVVDDLAFQN